VAAHFYDPVSRQLLEAFPKLGGTQIISFIVLFFLTWFCISFVGFWMARVVRVTGLAFLDRISGGILGLGKALILAMILISVLTLFVSPQSPFLRQSYLAPYVQETARIVIQATPQRVQNLFDEKRKELGRYWIDRNDETKKPSTPLRKREPSI
jgi:membrane protein required for colicin V production